MKTRTARRTILLLLLPLLLLVPGAALAQDDAAGTDTTMTAPQTVDEAMRDVQRLLIGQGVRGVPTAELQRALAAWRETLQDDPAMETISVQVLAVEEALLAEPFDEAALVEALQELALAMRAVASDDVPDEQSLLVELASLIDQTADYIQNEGYTPRMEVEAP